MSHVDDHTTDAAGPEDDAFAARLSALLGEDDAAEDAAADGGADDESAFAPGARTRSTRGASAAPAGAGAGGAGGDLDDDALDEGDLDPGFDADLDEIAPTSWADPVAEAEALRAADEAAFQDQLARTRKPVRDTRGQRRKEWRQTERARRYAARRSVRFPIFTRSVLLWMMIFAIAGLTFGASGAFWWAQFNSQITELKDETRDFQQRSQNAQIQIDAERNLALTQIKEANKPLAGFLSEAIIVQLADKFQNKVWYVETKDDEGEATAGAAFPVGSTDGESLLVTSYSVVKAASVTPGPEIHLKKGGDDLIAELYTWDPVNDLALLRVDRGGMEVLDWVGSDDQIGLQGSRVFMVSGWGGANATLAPGLVVDVNLFGIRHNGQISSDFRGGPIINAGGKIVAVTSLDYDPPRFGTGGLTFAPMVSKVCDHIMSCGIGVKKTKAEQPDPKAPATTVPTGGGVDAGTAGGR